MALTHTQVSTRLLLIYLAILLLCLFTGQSLLLALVVVIALALLVGQGDIPKSWRIHLYLVGFICIGVLPLSLSLGDCYTTEAYCRLGAWQITADSLKLALRVGLRAWACSLLIRLMLIHIPIYRLCQILRSWSVPRLLVELIELSYRYIHLLLGQSERIYEAQLLRLGYGSWHKRYQHGSQLLARSFVLAHSESEEVYEGLLSRQFKEEQSVIRQAQAETSQELGTKLLTLKDICYRYKGEEHLALNKLSLDIGRGERIVLLGANGAGKSTLMHIISGLRREASGMLYLGEELLDKSAHNLTKQRRHIALVMQNANHQLFCPSVEDEIAFGLRNSGLPEGEVAERVEEIIQTYALEELRHKAPHLLSEGQKKWVSLAAMMALRPELILMDEPTACLDCAYTERIMTLVEGFCREGQSVILSTHDMNLAYAWADRALVLCQGELLYDGSLPELFENEELLRKARLHRPHGYKPIPITSGGADERYGIALFHNVVSLTTLIVGGGKGAERKAKTLSEVGAKWIVLSPELSPELKQLVEQGCGTWYQGSFPCEDFEVLRAKAGLLVAATGLASIDKEICYLAMRQGQLAVALSDPLAGNVQFAAQGEYAGISLAVHSRYRLPEVTRAIRDISLGTLAPLRSEELQRLSELRQQQHNEAYIQERDRILALMSYDRTDKR